MKSEFRVWRHPNRDARMTRSNAGVAQLVEHVIRNDGVGGSSPFTGTIFPVEF